MKNKIFNPGALDGLTIFRFAHIWKDSNCGGVENYLSALNRCLLKRNKIRIIQMYLSKCDNHKSVEIDRFGQGELVWIPSIVMEKNDLKKSILHHLWKKLFWNYSNSGEFHADLLLSLSEYKIDLCIFHWISDDSKVVLDHFKNRNIPFLVINHFENKRLKRNYIKKQIVGAKGIGGVSESNIPNFVKNRFSNLSDGIDIDFFKKEKAFPLDKVPKEPIILLPARITEAKGHIDAVRVLGRIRRENFNVVLAFAGRLESQRFMRKLKKIIDEEGVRKYVIFLGQISSLALRNWYAASQIVILPSYNEGLGRVLIEAQAMERPVVAYAVGGTSEAVQNGIGGYLVPKGNLDALTWRVTEILRCTKKFEKMGKNGRVYVVNKFSIESLTIRHEKFYLSVFSSSQS